MIETICKFILYLMAILFLIVVFAIGLIFIGPIYVINHLFYKNNYEDPSDQSYGFKHNDIIWFCGDSEMGPYISRIDLLLHQTVFAVPMSLTDREKWIEISKGASSFYPKESLKNSRHTNIEDYNDVKKALYEFFNNEYAEKYLKEWKDGLNKNSQR